MGAATPAEEANRLADVELASATAAGQPSAYLAARQKRAREGFLTYDRDSVAARDGCYYVAGWPKKLWGVVFLGFAIFCFVWGGDMVREHEFSDAEGIMSGAMAGVVWVGAGFISLCMCCFSCVYSNADYANMNESLNTVGFTGATGVA